MTAQILTPKFGQRQRPGAWMFVVHFAGGAVRHKAKMGKTQADAVMQLIDELHDDPEVVRIQSTPLTGVQVEELLEQAAASVLPLPALPAPVRAGGAA